MNHKATPRQRKYPYTIECDLHHVSLEGRYWMKYNTIDLCWWKTNWRTWKEYVYLTNHRLHPSRRTVREVKRSIDAVRFASRADALYFKLVFL